MTYPTCYDRAVEALLKPHKDLPKAETPDVWADGERPTFLAMKN